MWTQQRTFLLGPVRWPLTHLRSLYKRHQRPWAVKQTCGILGSVCKECPKKNRPSQSAASLTCPSLLRRCTESQQSAPPALRAKSCVKKNSPVLACATPCWDDGCRGDQWWLVAQDQSRTNMLENSGAPNHWISFAAAITEIKIHYIYRDSKNWYIQVKPSYQ